MIICNATEQFLRTSPESCSVMYSTLIAAYSSEDKIEMTIDNAPSNSCVLPVWHQADIRTLSIKKQ